MLNQNLEVSTSELNFLQFIWSEVFKAAGHYGPQKVNELPVLTSRKKEGVLLLFVCQVWSFGLLVLRSVTQCRLVWFNFTRLAWSLERLTSMIHLCVWSSFLTGRRGIVSTRLIVIVQWQSTSCFERPFWSAAAFNLWTVRILLSNRTLTNMIGPTQNFRLL